MIKLNGHPIVPTLFPDRTSQVWQLDPSIIEELYDSIYNPKIEWKFENEAEFLHVAQLKKLVDKANCQTILYLPYLPYGRQDKEVENNSTFALRVFIDLLRVLNFREIVVVDPHSNLLLEKLDNVRAIYPNYGRILGDLKPDLVCYPDSGAYKKYGRMINWPFIYGKKERSGADGKIVSYALFTGDSYTRIGEHEGWPETIGNLEGKKVLIIDDLCDGGATFIKVAEKLLALKVASVSLFVTHGLFTKGLTPLKDAGIEHIYVYDKDNEYKERWEFRQ